MMLLAALIARSHLKTDKVRLSRASITAQIQQFPRRGVNLDVTGKVYGSFTVYHSGSRLHEQVLSCAESLYLPATLARNTRTSTAPMWCPNCQQDVPAIAQGDAARCAGCGRELVRNITTFDSQEQHSTASVAELNPSIEVLECSDFSASAIEFSPTSFDTAPFETAFSTAASEIGSTSSSKPVALGIAADEFAEQEPAAASLEAWLLDEQMQALRRRLNLPPLRDLPGDLPTAGFDRAMGLDRRLSREALDEIETAAPARSKKITRHTSKPTNEVRHDSANSNIDKSASSVSRKRSSTMAWLILSLGLMSFVCGSVLLGWSLVGRRGDLWNVGMPFALVGQFGLLLGLVLQLDNLWQANRRTTETLNQVDERLEEINHATTLLQTYNSTPGQSFYVHMAENAHPHLLLADLTGQLDLLATKLSQQR
jgi:hypothetical protein